jgi:hypothetical protein
LPADARTTHDDEVTAAFALISGTFGLFLAVAAAAASRNAPWLNRLLAIRLGLRSRGVAVAYLGTLALLFVVIAAMWLIVPMGALRPSLDLVLAFLLAGWLVAWLVMLIFSGRVRRRESRLPDVGRPE